ncbi:MAG TPA: tetratricopeptide repeat protein, partial [Clostridia bacterium]
MIDIDRIRSDAEKGIDDAIVELGICYLKGRGIQKNRSEAVNQFKIAASKNNCEGMFNLAMCLLKGQGCSVNKAEAIKFLEKAVELSHIKSMNFLGHFYSENRNFEKAIEYYKCSSDLKDPFGMRSLASLYMRNPENRYEAKKKFFESYIMLDNTPNEFVSVLKNYEMNNLFNMVMNSFKKDYLSYEGVCALLTIPSFTPPFIWEIVKNNKGLGVKQTIWNKNKDEGIIKNILMNDIEKSDINL